MSRQALGTSYLAGLAVLTAAILLNVLAGRLGLSTWYGFLAAAASDPLSAVRDLRAGDWLFLLVIYPGLLGACAYPVITGISSRPDR
jgi:uncharacterized membrane protein YczE